MFGIGPATRIYLAAGATDMRQGFEGLYGLVRDRLQLEPLSGHLFLFTNAQRNRLKVLFWDGSGLWVCAKRLEKGRFRWPQAEAGQNKVTLSHEELALLVGGIDLAGSQRRAWFRKIAAEAEGEPAAQPPRTTIGVQGGMA
jgi:transposase